MEAPGVAEGGRQVTRAAFAGALLGAISAQVIPACLPTQHPCVTAYDKARTPEEIAEVDKVCEHMLLMPVSNSGGHGGASGAGGGDGGGQ